MQNKFSPAPILPIIPGEIFLPPFSFRYGDRESTEFLSHWKREEEIVCVEGGNLHRVKFADTASGLVVTAEARTFKKYDASEWVIHFANTGETNTLVLEAIEPLHWRVPAGANPSELHYALGSEVALNDFENRTLALPNGSVHRLSSMAGRSSRNNLPFFNLQIGSGGVIGAIGWTGNWACTFSRDWNGDIKTVAGMQYSHFTLYPGEKVRTPSILLLNWQGDRIDAHNIWRRLLLAYYVPQKDEKPVNVPAFYCVWGTNTSEWHMETAKRLIDAKVPIEGYWIDAGWYGDQPQIADANVFNTNWAKNRGSWRPSRECYPEGMRPLTTFLKDQRLDFLLWFETEVADEGSDLLTTHPEWFFRSETASGGLLNLGNPDARRGITELISKLISEHGITWYRQDFNMDPESSWRSGDIPDRIGITEIRFVEGLYAFWDELLARHPGLLIDNCSSGGRRIDLETIQRSVPLWRSDYQCNPSFDPVGSQHHTAGLAPWVPLSSGVVGTADTYGLRSCYSAGLIIESGMCGSKNLSEDWLRRAVEEFREVRPYIYGDYYPIRPFDYFDAGWIVWQFHRPDLEAGLVIILRRRHAFHSDFELKLRALDLDVEYSVEIRRELGKAPETKLRGKDLEALKVTLSEKPGSAVIFYRKE